MFDTFDFSVLNDPDFKEDSVREEIIVPIIKLLGYKASGDNRVVRSRKLNHPYISVGSGRRQLSIIPDYLFEVSGKPFWVLDAKSPNEKITSGKHVEQAYSYAIHPEIRTELFALCNGREFALFSIKKINPILHFEIPDYTSNLERMIRILSPEIKGDPELVNYHPDYGLHLHMLGISPGFKYIAMAVHASMISKISENEYTTMTVILDDIERVCSFDFNPEQFEKLISFLPKSQGVKLRQALSHQPFSINLEGEEFLFGVSSELSNQIIENAEETYIPFKVKDFFPYSSVD